MTSVIDFVKAILEDIPSINHTRWKWLGATSEHHDDHDKAKVGYQNAPEHGNF